MRRLTGHSVEGDAANHQLGVIATETTAPGGACHRYQIIGFSTNSNPSAMAGEKDKSTLTILFQHGPVREAGVNGVTDEALLAILIDRLKGSQDDCMVVAHAYLERAQVWLRSRMIDRPKGRK